MSEQQRIREALTDIENALKEHDIYPAYDESELAEIAALRNEYRARLSRTEKGTNDE